MSFKEFESKYYNFYRFSSIVKDVLIVPQDVVIPYDVEMEVIYNSFEKINWELLEKDPSLDPYSLSVNHIKDDLELRIALTNLNENT